MFGVRISPAIAQMARFTLTTLLFLLTFPLIGFSTRPPTQLYLFAALWTLYLTTLGLGIAFIQLQFFCPAICQGNKTSNHIALTFDDGPDPQLTPALLDLLKKENIQATFFVIGKNVEAYPAIANRIVAEGHLIANHTHHHAWNTPLLGHRALQKEIHQAQTAITTATGQTPQYFRPPIGLTTPNYKPALKNLNLKMIGWNVRSLDTIRPPKSVIKRVCKKTKPGSIILLHDTKTPPEIFLPMLTQIIQTLRSKGFEFVRIDHLLTPLETRSPRLRVSALKE